MITDIIQSVVVKGLTEYINVWLYAVTDDGFKIVPDKVIVAMNCNREF